MLTHKIKTILLCGLLACFLAGCAARQKSFDTTDINDLQNLSFESSAAAKPTVGKIRLQALKDTALSVGAQGG